MVIGRDGARLGIPLDLSDFGRGEEERGVLAGGKVGVRGGCAFKPVGQQELRIVLADGCGDDEGGMGGGRGTHLWKTWWKRTENGEKQTMALY